MGTREEVLDRVKQSLNRQQTGPVVPELPALDPSGVMPALTPEEYLSKFEVEWQKVGGMTYRVASIEELAAVLQKIIGPSESQTAVLSRNPILADLGIAGRLNALNKFTMSWAEGTSTDVANSLPDFNKAAFAAGIGITGVDFVLAESGTLLLSSATEGVQVASLAPPIHVALYRRGQIVGSLDEILARLPISKSPDTTTLGRSVVFITGTSRTADIEQILIRGVHGPREVHAILVEDRCR